MGPRIANRGYPGRAPRRVTGGRRFNGSTVREPWLSSNPAIEMRTHVKLQWVHGSRTVVISKQESDFIKKYLASMGPRFANRGYPFHVAVYGPLIGSFNGSTVREP